jgi:hypothetical protein
VTLGIQPLLPRLQRKRLRRLDLGAYLSDRFLVRLADDARHGDPLPGLITREQPVDGHAHVHVVEDHRPTPTLTQGVDALVLGGRLRQALGCPDRERDVHARFLPLPGDVLAGPRHLHFEQDGALDGSSMAPEPRLPVHDVALFRTAPREDSDPTFNSEPNRRLNVALSSFILTRCAHPRTTSRNSSPYRSSFRSPTPLTSRSSSGVAGRRAAISRNVES